MGSGTTALSTWDTNGVEMKCDVTAAGGVVAHVGVSDVFAHDLLSAPGRVARLRVRRPRPGAGDDVRHPPILDRAGDQRRGGLLRVRFRRRCRGCRPGPSRVCIFRRDALSGTQRDDRRRDRRPGRQRGRGPPRRRAAICVTHVAAANFPDAVDRHPVGGGRAGQPATGARAGVPELRSDLRAVPRQRRVRERQGQRARAGSIRSGARCTCSSGSTRRRYPANARAGEVIGYLAGTRPAPPGLDLVKIEAQRHAVPQCAMRVRRAQEMGPAMPLAPRGRVRLLLREGRDRRDQLQGLRVRGGVPGERARLQLRLLRGAVSAAPRHLPSRNVR